MIPIIISDLDLKLRFHSHSPSDGPRLFGANLWIFTTVRIRLRSFPRMSFL